MDAIRHHRRVSYVLSVVCFVGFCGVLGWLVSGCTPGSEVARAKNAVDLAGYTAALDDCRADGKRAKSWAVYQACADEADRKYGRDGGAK